ncbi:uncharacterized protein LOC119986895 [Tripterygium wilfordii]|uniref:uncharacterized protein LOC119986895 n=1 Tax=Tripterygium wilfordii TaxID=458696 RepID=UPI0018F7F58D|nr:uncharacterized protein LOC119986895 [Tripterygium wilfordii]
MVDILHSFYPLANANSALIWIIEKLWGEDLRLSSDSDIILDEIKQEEKLLDASEENIEVDVTNEFSTDMVFNSHQSLIEWIQNTGRNLRFVIITKRTEIGGFGRRHKLLLQCERGGTYKDDDWMVSVVCGTHNHSAALYMESHAYVGRFSTTKNDILVDLSKNLVKPRNILYTLKKGHKADKSQMQQLMSFLHQYGYIFFNLSNAQIDELEELFFTHPGSLELLREFPHVLLMDATYKTNKFKMSLVEIIGVTSTKMTF